MKRLLIFGLLLVSTVSHAVQVSNLYSAVVRLPASLDDRQILNRAFNEAIDRVLVRVSGQKQNLSQSILNQAHRSVSSWVSQHSVQNSEAMVEGEAGMEPAKEITVTFYKESVDTFLFDNGLPVWSDNRPSILLWVIEDNNGQRQMFGANQPSVTLSKLFEQAKGFGLPVYAPLVDETDLKALSASALWGFFEEDIQAASKRYQTDVVLALRLSRFNGEAVVDSLLISPNQSSNLMSITKPTREEAINEVLASLSTLLSNRYASVRMLNPQQVFVKVEGVHNYSAIETLRQYMASIGVVKQVQLASIVDGQVGFDMLLNGTPEKFANTVALNSVLTIRPQTSSIANPLSQTLKYQYTGKGKVND